MTTGAENEFTKAVKDDRILSGLVASPDKTELANASVKGVRLASLDFYRALIMVLLMLESTGLYEHLLRMSTPGSFLHSLSIQFTHYRARFAFLGFNTTGLHVHCRCGNGFFIV